jgi:hypothetical protein
MILALALVTAAGAAEPDAEPRSDEDGQPEPQTEDNWRDDPSVRRHPGSYLGGGIGYVQSRAWLPSNEEHGDLAFGPLHTWGQYFRVGDAFFEWFAVGFQINVTSTTQDGISVGAFSLLLDTTLYPWQGLGIRPSVGLGLGFAQGKKDWEFGGGGPGALSLALFYEIRILRLLVVSPVAQVYWVTGEEFDGLFLLFGIEVTKWFDTAEG